jgi:hypothetical protein
MEDPKLWQELDDALTAWAVNGNATTAHNLATVAGKLLEAHDRDPPEEGAAVLLRLAGQHLSDAAHCLEMAREGKLEQLADELARRTRGMMVQT